VIGPAGPADVAAVVRLEQVCQGPDAWSEALVGEGVAGGLPTVHHLVAREADEIVGYAVASLAGDVAELQRIGVDPGHRRRGVAGRLLDGVVDLAARDGAERVLLEVREDNDGALAFYAARGFAEIARRPRYYRDGATAVVLERAITGPDVKVCTTS
jgi:ribosomal-protein-alanine N-acetyltransferase